MPNRIAALVQVLKDDPTIAPKTGARVFPNELPDQVVNRMPLFALVIRPAGGGAAFGGGLQDFSDQRVDIHHYGATPKGAYELYTLTAQVLKHLPRRSVGDTLLHWARPAGGPNQMREPQAGWPGGVPDDSIHWPFVVASWQVLAADVPIGVA